MAAQLTAMKGWSERSPWSWIQRANISLPTPVSPSSSTVMGLAAALATRSKAPRKPGEAPMSLAAGALGAEAAAQADQLLAHFVELALQVVGLEVVQVGVVAPVGQRLTDDVAVGVTTGHAGGLLEDHRAVEELGDVARGVADDAPAGRVFTNAEELQVGIGLPGVAPVHLAGKAAALPVQVGLDDGGLDQAFEGVEFGADAEDIIGVASAEQLLGQLGVLLAGGETHADQQALGPLGTEGVEQLAAQGPHGPGVEQQHAVLVQPDLPFVHIEAQT